MMAQARALRALGRAFGERAEKVLAYADHGPLRAKLLDDMAVAYEAAADDLERQWREANEALTAKFCVRCCEADIPTDQTTCPACGAVLSDRSKRKGTGDAQG